MADEDPQPLAKRRVSPPPVEFLKPGEAQTPAPQERPAAWVPRPEEYQAPSPSWTPPSAAKPRANLPTVAGVLLVLAGILGIASSVYSAVNLPSVAEYANFTNNSPELIAFAQVCGLISIWSQAVAILGGVMALQRRNWRLTLVCAIFSVLTIGFLFEASLLGAFGLVLVLLSRSSFQA